MATKHSHSCTCKHESVEYCPTCKVVHCLNCKIEWTQRGFTTWTYPSYSTYYGNAMSGGAAGAGVYGTSAIPTFSSAVTGTSNSFSKETLDVLCKHDK